MVLCNKESMGKARNTPAQVPIWLLQLSGVERATKEGATTSHDNNEIAIEIRSSVASTCKSAVRRAGRAGKVRSGRPVGEH